MADPSEGSKGASRGSTALATTTTTIHTTIYRSRCVYSPRGEDAWPPGREAIVQVSTATQKDGVAQDDTKL